MGQDPLKKLNEIDRALSALHKTFEQYFLGFERLAPDQERQQLRRDLLALRSNSGQLNTAIKFRLNTLWQRFVTYDQLWNRTLKQIEDGTYRRDVQRAKRKAKKQVQQGKEGQEGKPEPVAKPQPKTAPRGHLSDNQVKRIYDTYVLARRRTGESTRVSMDSLSAQLKERASTMANKHNCERIDFKVVIKGGRALIKALPRAE